VRGRNAITEHGLIATFSNGQSRHFPGKSALADAIAWADDRDTQVCVFSTPDTILRDLAGTRAREDAPVGAKYLRRELPLYDAPEERMLRGARRLDLYSWPKIPRRWWPLRWGRK